MDDCSIKIENLPEVPIVDNLRKEFKNDAPRFVSTIMYMMNEELSGFSKDFIEFYKAKYNLKSDPVFKSGNAAVLKKVKEAAIEYENKHNHRITTKTNQGTDRISLALYEYSNPNARSEGQRHVSWIILDIFKNNKFNNIEIKGNKIKEYLKRTRAIWNSYIVNRGIALTGKTKEEIQNEFIAAEDKRAFIDELLGGKNKTEQNQNMYAVWCELNVNDDFAIEYIKDLFNNPILCKVLSDSSRDLDELNDEANAESNPDLNESVSTDVEDALTDVDYTVANYEHSGIKNDFTKHINDIVKIYFDTLPKLTENSENSYDTNNYFGLPSRMSSKECIQFMYSINESFNDIDSMIKAIEQAAINIPKFHSFSIFAKFLRHNLDFASAIFSTFSKPKFHTVEVVVDGDRTVTRIANDRVNKTSAMFFDFQNDIKSSIVNEAQDTMKGFLDEIGADVSQLNTIIGQLNNKNLTPADRTNREKELNVTKKKAVASITKLLKLYFPSIEIDSIRSYIELNDNANVSNTNYYNNCLTLYSILKQIVEHQKSSKESYDLMQSNIAAVEDYNSKLIENSKDGYVPASEYLSDSEYRNDDYIDVHTPDIKRLVSILSPYTVGNIRLNDRNIYGNNQSAILNASWISGIKHMTDTFYKGLDANGKQVLKNDELIAWGTRKLLNVSQCRASSLLVEQVDENGVVLNKDTAIFRIVNNTLELTKDADKILKIVLFNGSSNINDGSNMSYAKMTSSDFYPTSYMAFFSTIDETAKHLSLATYFPKVPSDAPNMFAIQSIRHDATKLLIVKDPETLENNIKNIIKDTVPFISLDEYKEKYLSRSDKFYSEIYDSQLVGMLTNNRRIAITNPDSIKKIGKTNEDDTYEAYVTYKTKSGVLCVLKGIVSKNGKNVYLNKEEVTGVIGVDLNKGERLKELPTVVVNGLSDYYKNRLDNGDVKIGNKIYNKTEYAVDVNHPMFKMIRNQFKQEVIDAATAVSHYFVIRKKDNGKYEVVLDKDKNGIYKPVINPKADITRGYENYHIRNNSLIIYNEEKGTYHLTGDVFHFINFTLSKINDKNDVELVKYFEPILDESINPNADINDDSINILYGGGIELVCDDNGKVIDVEFNKKLLNRINNALSNYLFDYFEQTKENVYKNRRFIKNVPVDQEHIVDYAANNLLMQFNYDYIFDGSPKLYKSNQDVIKRVKQYQGSGSPYGNANYSASFVPNMEETNNSFLNNGTISRLKTVDGKQTIVDTPITEIFDKYDLLRGVRQRNGFYAVTIKNTKKTNTKILEILRQQLIKECGVSPEHADEILYGSEEVDKETGKKVRTKGYQNTKVNDAQSYITFQEFVRRLSAKGQLKRYLPLIERIADESKPISAKDISEFVQIQKNFYFDFFYDERYGIEVTRQIKNAEFVLIPRFIKGTQLMEVYNAMQRAGIDQLNTKETSKAANERVLKIWDDNEEFDTETIDTFVTQAIEDRQIYSYNNLYTQQETPQHMDAENKAGIQFMKKILDNIPAKGHPLSEVKQQFFNTYCENIKESAINLLRQLEIPIDENGEIEVDENGVIKGYNSKILYKRLLEEARRNGVDDNQKDYFEIPEGETSPSMVSYMNTYLSKFESVFQSMFNSMITRQKLPGFHAAQLTSVGFKPYGNENLKVSYSTDLEYHRDGKPYIEVILPYKALGIDKNSEHYKDMTDEQILEELEAKGLREFIGYRIPTEGKQSMAVMRIKGFIDDSLGSTIVVPNDWVSQTGSDFDIDSVYAIVHEHIIDKTGEIYKVSFKDADKRTIKDWYNYLNDNVDDANENSSEKIRANIEEFKNSLSIDIRELIFESEEAFNKLPDKYKKVIANLHKIIKASQTDNKLNKSDKFVELLNETNKRLLATVRNLDKHPQLKEYIEICSKISSSVESFKDKVIKERLNEYNKLAKKNGLLTFDDFKKSENDLRANSRKARNSRILDLALEILRSPASLEENLSRSNFDKITEAKAAKMDPNILRERKNRNPHNINDQVFYQEEVMSGRVLKGMSVALDTMCSVCNAVRPILEETIRIVYNTKEINPKTANEAFDCEVDESKGTILVRHNNYGWSKNDKTVDGYILTSYSSETTAYILDAVKEGSILNVNSYTFPVWKTLANIGCNYGTSIAFITQPAISEIVAIHNAKNSVFNKGYGNVLNEAIKNICSRIDPSIDTNQNLATILSKINTKYKDIINSIFNIGDGNVTFAMNPNSLATIPIISEALDDRINKIGKFKDPNSIESAIFDLGIALIYTRLHGIANKIGSISRCCNPDKFGAKQTVYSTRKVFNDILNCIYKNDTTFEDVEDEIVDIDITNKTKKYILSVNGKHILNAIYPGVENENIDKRNIIDNIIINGKITDSAYPPLFAFLKYSTAISTLLAKNIFETQHESFTNIIEGLGKNFSGHNKEVSEEIYIDFQRYLLSTMYSNVPAIKYAVTVRKKDGKIVLGFNEPTASNSALAREETIRIWGFGHTSDLSTPVKETITTSRGTRTRTTFKEFKINDITNPTEDEIIEFEKLSPAQKIFFIQSNFDSAGIFNLLSVTLHNTRSRARYKNAQTIRFIDENINSNDVYRMFKDAFESDNPLIVSTAIDIVKYGVQVEGLRMTATAVNKVIDNDCLINEIEDGNGLSFVSSMRNQMRNFGNAGNTCGDAISINKTYENYLRSLPANLPIRTFYLNNKNKREYNMYPISYGTYCIKMDNSSENTDENIIKFNNMLVKMGVKYKNITDEEYSTNRYIILSDPENGSLLYKIYDLGDQIILTPLNKLEPNENSQWSANPANNKTYLSPEAYEKLANSYATIAAEQEYNKAYVRSAVESIKKQAEDRSTVVYVDSFSKIKHKANPAFNLKKIIENENDKDYGKALSLVNDIIKHFSEITSEPLFVNNGLISDNIFTEGRNYGSVQSIKFPNGDIHNFLIFIPDKINKIEQAYLRPKNNAEKANPNEIENESARKIISNAAESGYKYLRNMAVVVQVDSIKPTNKTNDTSEAYASTVEDKIVDVSFLATSISTNAGNQTKLVDYTNQFKNNLYANDITPDAESVKNNLLVSMQETASFAVKTAKYLRDEMCDRFMEDPDDLNAYIKITDPKVQEYIFKDAVLMDKYMQTLNTINAFLRKIEPITHESFEDAQLKGLVEDIRLAIKNNLEDIPLDKLYHDSANGILKAKSTNPLVQQNYLDVMDAYWKTYGSMWKYFSIMENGTPILQTVLADVMTNIDAQQRAKVKTIKAYRKGLDEIFERAKARGEEINLKHIIDENGDFIGLATREFSEKLEELRNNVHKHPIGSIDHLRAKLELEEFLCRHVNREANNDYYLTKLNIERKLLDNIPDLYSKYMKLYYRRLEIYAYASKEHLTDELKQELQEINGAMSNLYLENGYIDDNGVYQPREHFNPNTNYTAQEIKNLKLYSYESAAYLGYYVNALKELDNKTFEQKELLSFRRTLNANLNLIRRLERRVNGIPTVDQAVLNQNPEYVKAYNWIKENAYFGLHIEYAENNIPASLGAKIMRAFQYLGRTRNNTPKHSAFYNEEYRDVYGVIDGRKLSNKERSEIKIIDKAKTLPVVRNAAPEEHIDRVLISNKQPDNAIFSNVFYKKLSVGAKQKDVNYYRIVTELNKLLEPLLGAIDGYVHFERIEDNAKGIETIKKIAELYNQLSQYVNTDVDADGNINGSGVSNFIKNEVEFVTNTELFKQQVNDIRSRRVSNEYLEAILQVFYIKDRNGNYAIDPSTGEFIPNRFLYSYAKPKGNPGDRIYDRYVSSEEQEARALVSKYYETVPTKYYEYAKEEAIKNGTYDQWYEENHYYNSFTRRMEPISCWVTSTPKTEYFINNSLEGEWRPKQGQTNRKVKDGKTEIIINGQVQTIINPSEDKTNHDFKPNEGYVANYKVGSGYDSNVTLNRSEKEMLDFLKATLYSTAKTSKAKRFLDKGHAPRQFKSKDSVSKKIIKEVGKGIGVGLTENNGYNPFRGEIDYAYDEDIPMPMLTELHTANVNELNKELTNLQNNPPVKEDNENENDFNDRVEKHKEAIKEVKNKIAKERASVLDNNWYDVIENYLAKSADYNAVHDNKNKLFYLLNILKDLKMYSREHGSYGDLKKQRVNSDGTVVYDTTIDKELIEQYENFIRRLLYNEWKEPEGKLTAMANFLQSFSSANYMMFNVRGGVANVTLGETGILAEAAASEYLGKASWGFGTWEYTKGIMSYTASAYNYAATGKKRYYSKQDAIIGELNVVDYDESTGVLRNVDLSHYSEVARNVAYSPQHIGEHFMQNSVLFAILHGHKIFDTEQGIMAMNKNQYVAYRQAKLLEEVLTEEQLDKFNEFKNKIKANKDELAKYAWYRQEALSRFMYLHCTKEQRKEFINKRKEQRKKIEEEFDAKTNIYEQLELTSEGNLGYVNGSELQNLDRIKANTLGNISEAELLIAKLAEKTRKVNNKIHGIYNKREAAHIESKWYGGLVMQYHKHIPMGLLKRYMARGHWNEFRNSVDKGMVQSVYDFMSLNIEKVQQDCNFTREETTALKSFMFNFTHCFKIISQLSATWEIVPDYEKANILRNVGDLFGTISALGTTAALWAIAEDDDPDGFWFNFLLYESDRLASEAFMYNPYGMIIEGKKLMSTPIAAGSVINDAANLLVGIVNWMTDENYDPYYHSGRFAGEHKFSVYIQRRIPIWNGIRNLVDIADNNNYYKVGANSIGLLDVKERVRE